MFNTIFKVSEKETRRQKMQINTLMPYLQCSLQEKLFKLGIECNFTLKYIKILLC